MPASAWSPTLLEVGIAGWSLMVAICSKVAPKSGFVGALVALEVAGVDREVGEVGEPADLPEPGDGRAGDHAETVEIDGLGADRVQVGVDELGVAQLVLGDVDRVDRQVVVDALQRLAIARIALGQLGVLLPQVGLDQLGRGQEPQDGDVAPGRVAWRTRPPRPSQAGRTAQVGAERRWRRQGREARAGEPGQAQEGAALRDAMSEDRVRIGSCTMTNSPRHRHQAVHVSCSCVAVLAGPTKAKLSPRPGRDHSPGHPASMSYGR